MKKIFYLLVLSVVFLTSCSKDEDIRFLEELNGSWNIDYSKDVYKDNAGNIYYDTTIINNGTFVFNKETNKVKMELLSVGINKEYDFIIFDNRTSMSLTNGSEYLKFKLSDYKKEQSINLYIKTILPDNTIEGYAKLSKQ
jgi:hypothetical protein